MLNDLIALCNSVDSTVDVEVGATTAIADNMTLGSTEASTDAPVAVPVAEPVVEHVAEPTPPTPEPEKADIVEANDVDMDVNVDKGTGADIDGLLEGNVDDDLAALVSLQAEYDDTDDVLATLTAEIEEQDAEQEQEEDEEPTPEPIIVGDGYATELWTKMASAIPSDDADAYALAFDMFLERIDTEVATLRHQVSLKAAG